MRISSSTDAAKRVNRYAGSPMESEMPQGWGDKIMHATFTGEGFTFMASDSSANGGTFDGVALSLFAESAVAKRAFDALAVGGTVTMPLAPVFWGGEFGSLVDKFGVSWMMSSR